MCLTYCTVVGINVDKVHLERFAMSIFFADRPRHPGPRRPPAKKHASFATQIRVLAHKTYMTAHYGVDPDVTSKRRVSRAVVSRSGHCSVRPRCNGENKKGGAKARCFHQVMADMARLE